MTSYRVKGTTGDVTSCDHCGRSDLRKTVVLAALDADGNEGDVTYFGTDCASRVTGRRAASITRDAAVADGERTKRQAWAVEILAAYGPVEHGTAREKADLYFGRNPHMRGRASARDEVAKFLADAREALAA